MNNKSGGLSLFLFDFFAGQIQLGIYRHGEKLPSIGKIASQFCVAPLTARAALQRLKEAGYITMSARKAATVAARISGEECQANAIRYAYSRRRSLQDMIAAMPFTLIPLVTRACEAADQETLDELIRMAKKKPRDKLLTIGYFCRLLRSLENPLAINLFTEMAEFVRFCDYDHSLDTLLSVQLYDIPSDISRCIKEQKPSGCREQLFGFFGVYQAYFDHILENVTCRDPVSPVAFQWNIYRDRPQVCYAICSQIVRDIIYGTYSPENFLPSNASLAKTFGVSPGTMRKIISYLNQFGMTKSINGKGTLVLSPEDYKLHIKNDEIHKSMLFYLQSVQIMALTCEAALETTLSNMGDDDLARLKSQLRRLAEFHGGKSCHIAIGLCMEWIQKKAPFATLREMYAKLGELMSWGYPLHIYKLGKGRSAQEDGCLRFTVNAIRFLDEKKFDSMAREFHEILCYNFVASQRTLVSLGVEKAGQILPPA